VRTLRRLAFLERSLAALLASALAPAPLRNFWHHSVIMPQAIKEENVTGGENPLTQKEASHPKGSTGQACLESYNYFTLRYCEYQLLVVIMTLATGEASYCGVASWGAGQ